MLLNTRYKCNVPSWFVKNNFSVESCSVKCNYYNNFPRKYHRQCKFVICCNKYVCKRWYRNWIVSKRKHTSTKLTKHNANIYYNTPNRHEIVITIAINWDLSLCLRFCSPADNRLFTFCKFAFIAPKEIVGRKQISEAMTILFLTWWRYLLALFVDLRKE